MMWAGLHRPEGAGEKNNSRKKVRTSNASSPLFMGFLSMALSGFIPHTVTARNPIQKCGCRKCQI
jgi:hypothetical protein